jgi:phage terminase small subunit
MSKLTAQQEKFCQAVADGMTQADAYRASYSTGNMKAASVHEKASQLAANVKVTSRIAELKAALAQKALWTREQSVAALVREIGGDRAADRISAVKALNEMHGYNAPTKIDMAAQISLAVEFIRPA